MCNIFEGIAVILLMVLIFAMGVLFFKLILPDLLSDTKDLFKSKNNTKPMELPPYFMLSEEVPIFEQIMTVTYQDGEQEEYVISEYARDEGYSHIVRVVEKLDTTRENIYRQLREDKFISLNWWTDSPQLLSTANIKSVEFSEPYDIGEEEVVSLIFEEKE
jgi:hypothetical protein